MIRMPVRGSVCRQEALPESRYRKPEWRMRLCDHFQGLKTMVAMMARPTVTIAFVFCLLHADGARAQYFPDQNLPPGTWPEVYRSSDWPSPGSPAPMAQRRPARYPTTNASRSPRGSGTAGRTGGAMSWGVPQTKPRSATFPTGLADDRRAAPSTYFQPSANGTPRPGARIQGGQGRRQLAGCCTHRLARLFGPQRRRDGQEYQRSETRQAGGTLSEPDAIQCRAFFVANTPQTWLAMASDFDRSAEGYAAHL